MPAPEPPQQPQQPQQPPARVEQTSSPWQRWSVLLPALTFLVGGALGAAVVGTAGQQTQTDPSVGAAAPATAIPQPTASGLVVQVPQPCLQAADGAGDAYTVVDQAVTAVRDLDARRLQELLDQVQDEQARLRALAAACQQQAGEALTRPATPANR